MINQNVVFILASMPEEKLSDSEKFKNDLQKWLKSMSPKQFKTAKTYLTIVNIILGFILAWVALWFLHTVTFKTLEQNTAQSFTINIFEWLAPIGLLLSIFLGLFGSLFLTQKNNERAVGALVFGFSLVFVSICIVIITIIFFAAQDGRFENIVGALRSFIDFGKVSIGPVGISIPATLIIMVIAASFLQGRKGNNQK